MEFEAYESHTKTTFKITYDYKHDQFRCTSDRDGESRVFQFRYQQTVELECWKDEIDDTVFITWKNKDQRKRIKRLVDYQECKSRIESAKAEMAMVEFSLKDLELDLEEAMELILDRPILLVLCLPVCVPRLKRNNWLPVDLLRYLATFL